MAEEIKFLDKRVISNIVIFFLSNNNQFILLYIRLVSLFVDLNQMLDQPLDFDFTIGPDNWGVYQENEEIQGIGTPLEVHINISRVGSKVMLDGVMTGSINVLCDRCLEAYDFDVSCSFRMYLAPQSHHPAEKDVSLSEEDMSVSFNTGEGIELFDIVREQIYLNLPMKALCRKDCEGLCSICGGNKNIEKCECEKENLDDRFSKLKNIKIRG